MHYRNGREAKNGDKVVQLSESYTTSTNADLVRITGFGILFDCLHVDDLAAVLAEKGLDKRPSGK